MSAPSWEFRQRMRARIGRAPYAGTVQRVERHPIPGRHYHVRYDTRGFDPLELMQQNRPAGLNQVMRDLHARRPDFLERRLDAYAKARTAAMRPTLARLRMVESAIGCDVACRDAVQAWRNVA